MDLWGDTPDPHYSSPVGCFMCGVVRDVKEQVWRLQEAHGTDCVNWFGTCVLRLKGSCSHVPMRTVLAVLLW